MDEGDAVTVDSTPWIAIMFESVWMMPHAQITRLYGGTRQNFTHPKPLRKAGQISGQNLLGTTLVWFFEMLLEASKVWGNQHDGTKEQRFGPVDPSSFVELWNLVELKFVVFEPPWVCIKILSKVVPPAVNISKAKLKPNLAQFTSLSQRPYALLHRKQWPTMISAAVKFSPRMYMFPLAFTKTSRI